MKAILPSQTIYYFMISMSKMQKDSYDRICNHVRNFSSDSTSSSSGGEKESFVLLNEARLQCSTGITTSTSDSGNVSSGGSGSGEGSKEEKLQKLFESNQKYQVCALCIVHYFYVIMHAQMQKSICSVAI